MARVFAGLISAATLLAGAGAAGAAQAPPDRYGPAASPLPDIYAPTAAGPVRAPRETARAAPLRVLDWPGKSLTTPAPSSYRPAASDAAASPARSLASPRFAPPPGRAAAPSPYIAPPASSGPPPAATSLAGPFASATSAATRSPTPPAAAWRETGPVQHARLYSLHRAYGMQPDPAPIPPQFFGPTADLTDPATPEPAPSRAANVASRNAVNAARLAAAEAN